MHVWNPIIYHAISIIHFISWNLFGQLQEFHAFIRLRRGSTVEFWMSVAVRESIRQWGVGVIFPKMRMASRTSLNQATLWYTNMAMENPPIEDVFPIGKGGFQLSWVMLVYWRVVVFPSKSWKLKITHILEEEMNQTWKSSFSSSTRRCFFFSLCVCVCLSQPWIVALSGVKLKPRSNQHKAKICISLEAPWPRARYEINIIFNILEWFPTQDARMKL